MNRKALSKAEGFIGGEGPIEAGESMGIEIILRQADFLGVWIAHIGQPFQPPGIIHGSSARGHFHLTITR